MWRASALPIARAVAVVEAQAVLGHQVDLARQPLGAGGEFRRLPGQRQQRPGAVAGIRQQAARAEIVADPVADHRLGGLPHVEARIERARHAFDHHHGLLQHDQFRPRLHVEQLGHLEQQRQQLGHGDGFGRLAVDRLADGADRLGEGRDVVMARHVAGLEMHLGDAADSRG